MKKILGIIILGVFILSILGSVSPKFESYVLKLAGDQKYAYSQIPLPPTIENNQNLAGQSDLPNPDDSDISYNIQSRDINLIK